MKYVVTIGGQSIAVDVQNGAVTIDGRSVETALGKAGGAVRRLAWGGSSSEVVLHPADEPNAWVIAHDGQRLVAGVLDERTSAIRAISGRAAAHAGHGTTIKAPMPGLVVRVLVKEGEEVAAGAGLIVVEAMKMENVLKAGGAGRVKSVKAKPGDKVEKGAVLVELE